MNFNPVVLAIPLYFTLILFELIYEAVKKRHTYRINDAITNISCGISSQIVGAFMKVLVVGIYVLIYEQLALFNIPVNWWTNVLLFIAIDFFYYWYHRASHEINFLWNFSHVVHHQSEDYNLSVALRQNSLGSLLSMSFYLPLAFVGFDPTAFVVMKGLNLIYQFWIHTEAIDKLPKPIEWLLNTPSHHRVHHGRNPKYIDRNHAGVFMLWDRMFGTFQAEEERPTYGVTKPLNTWNPVRANLEPVYLMAKQVWNTPGFMNKVKVLFYKPGWAPNEMGGYQPAPPIDHADPKFNTAPFKGLYPYLLVQFVIVLGITALFLFTMESMEFWGQLATAGYIIFSIIVLGMVLENRRTWFWIEWMRNTLLTSGLVAVFLSPNYPALISVFVLLGIWLIALIQRSQK